MSSAGPRRPSCCHLPSPVRPGGFDLSRLPRLGWSAPVTTRSGAWWWLASDGRLELSHTVARFAQQLGDRVLPVEVLTDGSGRAAAVVMEQAPPSFGGTVRQLASLAVALGLTAEDLRSHISAQVLDTGAAHLLVAAIDRAAVDRAQPNAALLAAELGTTKRRNATNVGC